MTHDSDFGTLAIHTEKKYFGIIYIRAKNLHTANVIKICKQLLDLKTEVKKGALIVVEETRLRIRNIDSD